MEISASWAPAAARARSLVADVDFLPRPCHDTAANFTTGSREWQHPLHTDTDVSEGAGETRSDWWDIPHTRPLLSELTLRQWLEEPTVMVSYPATVRLPRVHGGRPREACRELGDAAACPTHSSCPPHSSCSGVERRMLPGPLSAVQVKPRGARR